METTASGRCVVEMVVGTLPWDEIAKEVELATRHFSLAELGGEKKFVNIPRLVDWLTETPTPDLYPHLTGYGWEVIEYRVTKGMRTLKWKKFARNVFVVPIVESETILVGAEA